MLIPNWLMDILQWYHRKFHKQYSELFGGRFTVYCTCGEVLGREWVRLDPLLKIKFGGEINAS